MPNIVVHRALLTLAPALFAVILLPARGRGEEENLSSKQVVRAASQVFDEQLRSLQARDNIEIDDVESLAEWSKRIVVYQTILSDEWRLTQQVVSGVLPEATKIGQEWRDGYHKHIERMESLRQLVQSRHDQGKTTRSAILAAEFFHLDAKKLEEMFVMSRSAVDDQFQLEVREKLEPDAAAAKPVELFIVIDRENNLFVNEKQITLERLEALLRRKVAAEKNLSVIIRADPDSRFDRATEILDLCRQFGIDNCVVTTAGK